MATISYQASVQITGGPKVTAARTLAVDAYDVIDVVIPAGESRTVEIEPSGAAGQVKLLLLTSDAYADMEYTVGGTAHALDGPALLVGTGAVALLNDPPGELEFTNTGTEDQGVHVFVGRNAIAP